SLALPRASSGADRAAGTGLRKRGRHRSFHAKPPAGRPRRRCRKQKPRAVMAPSILSRSRPPHALGVATSPARIAWSHYAWSGSRGVDAIVTAFVLAPSRTSVSAPSDEGAALLE